MKKVFNSIIIFMLLVIFPSNVFALSATTRLDYRSKGSGVYTIIITLQNASDVTGFTSTVVNDGVVNNNDITCATGSTCTLVDGALSVSNTAGLTGEICRFTVKIEVSSLNFALSGSKISDASGTLKSVYNPSTTASGNTDNPDTGLISSLSLLSLLVISAVIANIISKQNKFKKI